MINYVSTKNAPMAIGPYSQGVINNGLLYTSGQIAIDPKTQKFINGSVEEQTEQVIKNLKGILEECNTSFDKVIKVTIFLTNLDNFDLVNTIYGEYFKSKPARSTVEVSALPKNALIEIECIATIS
ncbi:RidA family protein [Thiospirochaeta perfilievii]|uniref:RidA family protein n=1 Tax=Thiospirochaeta perfilievii TaxID=252967 RepID=UPI001658EA77|nr:RidA family protein [Thiospirochaeta perfilievii]